MDVNWTDAGEPPLGATAGPGTIVETVRTAVAMTRDQLSLLLDAYPEINKAYQAVCQNLLQDILSTPYP